MKKTLVSVVMSIFNEKVDRISNSIESILSQTYKDLELIIILDDPSNIEAKYFIEEIINRDSRVRILCNDKNIGLGASLNKGILVSKGEFIARMDTDDFSYPDRIEKQINYLNNNPHVSLLFTQWVEFDENNNKVYRKPKSLDFKNLKKNFFIKSLILHPTMIARREIFEKNKYPEMYRPEDLVLFLKLIRENLAFDVLEDVLYEYKVDRLNINNRYKKIRLYSANYLPKLWLEKKFYYNNVYFWLYFLRICFEYVMSRNYLIFRFLHAFSAKIWKAFFNSA